MKLKVFQKILTTVSALQADLGAGADCEDAVKFYPERHTGNTNVRFLDVTLPQVSARFRFVATFTREGELLYVDKQRWQNDGVTHEYLSH